MQKNMTYVMDKINQKIIKDRQSVGKLGATLKQRRKEHQFTLSHLSNKYAISISYISKIENDLIKPNIKYISPMLTELQIDEEMFESSEIMDAWYRLAINYHIDKENNRKQLYDYVTQRNDFQSKLIEFSVLVKENDFLKSNKFIGILIHNIDQMTPIEFCLFVFSLVEHHINDGDIITAAEVFGLIDGMYMVYDGLKLWAYKIAFKLSEYHVSLHQYRTIYHAYNKALMAHNMVDIIIRNKEIYNNQQPFDSPLSLSNYHDEEMYKNYRLSLIIHERYDSFLKLEHQHDLAQALYDDIVLNKKPKYKQIDFEPSLFEQTLREYFKEKYEKGNVVPFLRDIVFSSSEVSQHHYISNFFADRLIDYLANQNKYKECYLIYEKMRANERLRNAIIYINEQINYFP